MYITRKRNYYNLFDEMSNLFNDTFSFKNKAMKTDIIELENEYLLNIEVPGLSKEDISITFEDDYLIVKCKYSLNDEDNYLQKERFQGDIQRSYYVGDIVKDNINAKLNDGILSISVPKKCNESNNKTCISIE